MPKKTFLILLLSSFHPKNNLDIDRTNKKKNKIHFTLLLKIKESATAFLLNSVF